MDEEILGKGELHVYEISLDRAPLLLMRLVTSYVPTGYIRWLFQTTCISCLYVVCEEDSPYGVYLL